MSEVKFSPVPMQTEITTKSGLISTPWNAWFRQLREILINASQIEATEAAREAAASAALAATSASSAATQAGNASAAAGSASVSSTVAQSSSLQAQTSAEAAAASAAQAEAVLTGQSFVPDYIDKVLTVPFHRQMIAFQRVVIAPGGSLQILGRARIL